MNFPVSTLAIFGHGRPRPDVRKWLVMPEAPAYGREMDNRKHLYRALAARDPRFDGVFFIGVTSTKIYCRPICPARTPKEINCRFFDTPQAAESRGFRPCLRCRPELAPGLAPVDDAQRIAQLFVQRVDEGLSEHGGSLEDIAAQFELSARQVRRIIRHEMGVSPIQFIQSRRLLLAKQLLTETTLSITDIAFASGFASLRRFNDAFLMRYKMPPTRLRKKVLGGDDRALTDGTSTVQLVYRPPYDWEGMLRFLRARAGDRRESIADTAYRRTVRIGKHAGWICIRHDSDRRALLMQFTHSLTPVLPALLNRVRNLFDLSARPDIITSHLSSDPYIGPLVTANPGLRVPGAFNAQAMRVPDAFSNETIRKALGGVSAKRAEEISQAWRPWRSYAAMHLREAARLSPRRTRKRTAPHRTA